MKKRLIVINFKSYKESTGEKGLKLAKKLDMPNVVLAVASLDILNISQKCKNAKIFSQYIDPIEYGAYTGSLTALEVKNSGALGTLINHSEKPLKFKDLKQTLKIAKKYNLITIVCAKNLEMIKKIAKLKPDYIAIEPPYLISGKISVSEAKPDLIKNAVKYYKNILVGAGIHSKNDVEIAFKLGACGVLISSAIVKSKNPRKLLKEIITFS